MLILLSRRGKKGKGKKGDRDEDSDLQTSAQNGPDRKLTAKQKKKLLKEVVAFVPVESFAA